jgi:hypothetical protein
LQSHGACSGFYISQLASGTDSIDWIDKHSHATGCGHQLTQEFHPFCRQFGSENIETRQIAAWPSDASDETEPDRVFGDAEDDGDCRCRGLGSERSSGTCGRSNHGDLSAN